MNRFSAVITGMFLFSCIANAGNVETFAGTGVKGFSGDGGPASKAQLNNPFHIARGPDGALYICDVDNHRVRKVAKDGIITTVAGNCAASQSSVDIINCICYIHDQTIVRMDLHKVCEASDLMTSNLR
jgi:hypothetical protein